MKIAIIGAGASGIMASIQAKRTNKDIKIDLFENNAKIGKKILASGNGRCNISNINISCNDYFGEDVNFINFVLKEFDFATFEKFCNSIGLFLEIKKDGKIYPKSNEAKSVVNLLSSQLQFLGINIFYETSIKRIEKNGEYFTLFSEHNTFGRYDKVLISSGLCAYPQLKSSCDGVEFAKSFNHDTNIIYPALVGLKIDQNDFSQIQGVKVKCKVELLSSNKKTQEVCGDVLWTFYGLSGFAILDISTLASYKLLKNEEVILSLNLLPTMEKSEVVSNIENLIKVQKDEKLSLLLSGLLSLKLCNFILKLCGFSKDIKASKISQKQVRTIANILQNWKLKVVQTNGFEHSEVCGGGVVTKQINPKTLESKLCKNLYFAGEVLDIVGKRGGYNLHFAFSSGFIAGKNLAK